MGKKIEYPEYLYATREDDGDGGYYFSAHETAVDLAEKGEKVQYGVYRLLEVNEIELSVNIHTVK